MGSVCDWCLRDADVQRVSWDIPGGVDRMYRALLCAGCRTAVVEGIGCAWRKRWRTLESVEKEGGDG